MLEENKTTRPSMHRENGVDKQFNTAWRTTKAN
jgi:hypothetical protein